MTMPITSVTKDPEKLHLTVVADFSVSQKRLWAAWEDPRQLERFWGPPFAPATFTHHDFRTGGRAEYFLTGPNGEKWPNSWKFTEVNPIGFFEAEDGDDNDEDMPTSMTFTFETTSTGSRMIHVTRFSSVEAMEKTIPGMEEGFRAAMPQLDALLEA
ncbi:SRPBCC family protein [Amycolatopsis keratiniphila]|uniref:Activator of HSP90 ATPase 1 family protein n=1 Tax=Amycolatopsis keratiniphila TaxID=129921 RepID=R4TBP5_9PSEU|nr:SRPBCC domain-containing protein [Amycolatopsis keratiniphila]AGM08252.1 activator of HSP90 ATPase 1 family protein [Amycolatopsis keratiniphila]